MSFCDDPDGPMDDPEWNIEPLSSDDQIRAEVETVELGLLESTELPVCLPEPSSPVARAGSPAVETPARKRHNHAATETYRPDRIDVF